MYKIKYFFFFFLFLISRIAFSTPPEDIFIQINGKYLSLKEAAANKHIDLETNNNKLEFKFEGISYPINSQNILFLFGRQKLTIDIENSYPNAKISLDNWDKGFTDSKGFAHFSQMYPETGKHVLKITNNKMVSSSFEFNLNQALTVSCSGKKQFRCVTSKA